MDSLLRNLLRSSRTQIDPNVLHFMKEFGLILFIYSIGMQVGPSFSHHSAKEASPSTY